MSEGQKRRADRQNVSYIPFDYRILKLRIRAFCGVRLFAGLLGMDPDRLARTLDDGGEFTQNEILRAAKLLDLDGREVTLLFFTKRVAGERYQQKYNCKE